MAIWTEIKKILNTSLGTSAETPLNEMILANAVFLGTKESASWALEQYGIGPAINYSFGINSSDLNSCMTLNDILANNNAIAAIGSNTDAVKFCSNNDELATKLVPYMDDYTALVSGYGYAKYSIGNTVKLNFGGTLLEFEVVAKNYLVQNKIVLVTKNIVENYVWNSAERNNYETSSIREYLNTVLIGKFDSEIQKAIVAAPVPCHNKSSAVTCYDKLWPLSYTEVGFGSNTYAPVEGQNLNFYTTNAKRIKYLNGTATYWWTRTPYTFTSDYAWNVYSDGSSNYYNVTNTRGVVFALVI